MSETNNHINYIEWRAKDLQAIKTFYSTIFGWKFTDYGDEYIAFEDSGISGGFVYSELPITQGALVIIYYNHLQEVRDRIVSHGGYITQDIFDFPGGSRFHFLDPAGNELAVWSDL